MGGVAEPRQLHGQAETGAFPHRALRIDPAVRGVRISWLMVARKIDFPSLASSAVRRAAIASASARLSALTSMKDQRA
jgi:hypothetical protein